MHGQEIPGLLSTLSGFELNPEEADKVGLAPYRERLNQLLGGLRSDQEKLDLSNMEIVVENDVESIILLPKDATHLERREKFLKELTSIFGEREVSENFLAAVQSEILLTTGDFGAHNRVIRFGKLNEPRLSSLETGVSVLADIGKDSSKIDIDDPSIYASGDWVSIKALPTMQLLLSGFYANSDIFTGKPCPPPYFGHLVDIEQSQN
jgi:hypothetical protein